MQSAAAELPSCCPLGLPVIQTARGFLAHFVSYAENKRSRRSAHAWAMKRMYSKTNRLKNRVSQANHRYQHLFLRSQTPAEPLTPPHHQEMIIFSVAGEANRRSIPCSSSNSRPT